MPPSQTSRYFVRLSLTLHTLLLCFLSHLCSATPMPPNPTLSDNLSGTLSDPFYGTLSDKPPSFSQHWELITNITVSGIMPVLKYRSRRTGLTVVLAQADSPIINGYICLATEAKDNNGLPHTLEHLVFLGSEDYPYKEVLDLLANRCLSDRTNAFTDTDHTCYTIFTAGSDGFLSILPVYVDHVFFPLLRQQDFLTEVHHISKEGEDAGVVYSEMQGVENGASNILYFATIGALYPVDNAANAANAANNVSSYGVQTGGMLRNLRDNTTIDLVRDYHRRFYQPRNAHITITGRIEAEEVFKALDRLERKTLLRRRTTTSSPPSLPFVRPFQTVYPPLTEDVNLRIEYPSDDESSGRLAFAWRLPFNLWEDVRTLHALKLLTRFLTATSVSPMMKAFVNNPRPLATNVDLDVYRYSQPAVALDFEDVPLANMTHIEARFKKVIRDMVNAGPEKFDLEKMHIIIRRKVLDHQVKLENSPHLLVPDRSILDLVYGHSRRDLGNFLLEGQEGPARMFLEQKPDYWLNLLNATFGEHRPRVRVLAYPSRKCNDQLTRQESERIRAQQEELGPEGLKLAGQLVKDAIHSQILPPNHVLESIPLASVDKIAFRPLNFFNYTTRQQPGGFDLRSIPLRFHLDHIQSQFVRYYVFLGLEHIRQEDRPYLVLLTESWLQSPLMINGSLISMESLLRRRSKDLLSLNNNLGYKGSVFFPGSQSDQMTFFCQTLLEKYVPGLELLKDALFRVRFTAERVHFILTQLLHNMPSLKLRPNIVLAAMSDDVYFNRTNVLHHASFLRQKRFLQKVAEQMKRDPEVVLKKLCQLQKSLLRPKNMFVYMATDVKKLTERYGKQSSGVWNNFFQHATEPVNYPQPEELVKRMQFTAERSYRDPNPPVRHLIAGIPATESCYLRQSASIPVTDWESDEVAAIRVMLQYLSDQMYNLIRGKGLTYGASMFASVQEGRMSVKFSRSSQLSEAYRAFRSILANYSSPVANFDRVLLDSAKGSQIYIWAEKEETVGKLSSVSLQSVLRMADDPFYNRRFIHKISRVAPADVKRAAQTYLPLFLDPLASQISVVCGPGEVDETSKVLNEFGFDMLVLRDLEDSLLAL